MHIMDGILSVPVLAVASGVGIAALGVGIKRLDEDRLPQTALLSAVFFVASLIHVPVGPASVHLILSGLAGLILGWAAVPAIAVGLLLQMLLFGFGGVTVVFANLACMAVPAVLVWYLCGKPVRQGPLGHVFAWGAVAGGLAVACGSLMVALLLSLSGSAFETAARLVVLGHLPVIAVEAVLVGAAAVFLRRVKPEVFGAPRQSLDAAAA